MTEIHGITKSDDGDCVVAVTFRNGELTIHATNNEFILPDNGLKEIMVYANCGDIILFHLSCVLETTSTWSIKKEGPKPAITADHTVEIDYMITGYKPNAVYKQFVLEFPELDRFIPSSCAITYKEDNLYTGDEIIHYKEKHEYQGVSFILSMESGVKSYRGIEARIYSCSQIIVNGDKNLDINEVIEIIGRLKILFSFLYNRRNVGIYKAILYGENNKSKIGHKIKSELVLFDKYTENVDSHSFIKEEIRFFDLKMNFSNLFNMVLNNHISYNNLHSSSKRRHLFDLEQCLGITASFERYVRDLLPEMRSESTRRYYEEASEVLEKYIKDNLISGKRKKIFNSVCKSIKRSPLSLEQKIIKACEGYEGWEPLNKCLEEDYHSNTNIYAKEANKWRNELAHDKSDYNPTCDTICAMRFIEKINYCIILREAGFTDSRIKIIVSKILG